MGTEGAVGQNPQGSDSGDWADAQQASTGGGHHAASCAESDGGRGAEEVSSASTLGGRSEHAAASRDAHPYPDSPSRPARRKGQGPVTLRVPTDEHPTIGAALAAAVSGDTVSVAAGTYQESMTIAAVDVDVVGEGDRAGVVVEAHGRPVLSFRAARGSVRNLTLRQSGAVCECAVEITGGELTLEGCDISGKGDAGVLVRGAGTRPTILRNLIRDGAGVGVLVSHWAAPVLDDNDISGHQLDGVVITEGGNPSVRRNRIHSCKTAGVVVKGGGEGLLEDNDIYANAIAGVVVHGRGAPTLRGNTIRDGAGKGVDVFDGGLGRLENNVVSGNEMDGIVVKTGADPVVVGNRVSGNRGNGVYVFEEGLGTFEDNDVFENESSGVVIRSGGNPTLRRNKVHHSKKNGTARQLSPLNPRTCRVNSTLWTRNLKPETIHHKPWTLKS